MFGCLASILLFFHFCF